MQVERLIARIRGQLELGTPDLEARSLAGEYAAVCQRARERLEQCATLVRSGNEHAAFQAAESEPDLLGLCAILSFAESDRWHALCRERGLPAGFPLDGQHVLAVEGLYGREIGENHPLYRDYRDAIRRREEDRALSVLRSIVRINPNDPNARSELARLSAKFLRESLGKVGSFFSEGRAEEAVELMNRMERFGANDLSGEPRWDEALQARVSWLRSKAAEQVERLLAEAKEARAGGHWETCAAALGRVRSLERDHQLTLAVVALAAMTELEGWAGEIAANAEAEASQRAALESLQDEWTLLQQEAVRGSSPAMLIVRLTSWLDRATLQAERLPEGILREARALRQNTRARLNRRYLVFTTSWVGGLLLLVAGVVYWNVLKTQAEESQDRFSEAARLLELYDHTSAQAALEAFERGSISAADQATRKEQALPLRARLSAQNETERRLSLEARALADRRLQGLALGNVAETENRADKYLKEYDQVGGTLQTKLKAILPEPEALLSACRQLLDRTRNDMAVQIAILNKAMGEATVGDLTKTAEALERLRSLLKTLTDAKFKDLDSAEAAVDRAELRLSGERKTIAALRSLQAAADLSGYLSALADTAANTAGEKSDLSSRASFIIAQAPTLKALPRSALAPRVGAMWDAALTADATGTFHPPVLNDVEQRGLRTLADTSLADTLRRCTLNLYSIRGTTPGRTVYIIGDITESRRPITDGFEFSQKAKELTREGAVVEFTWSRREFNNGVRAGEELANPTSIKELDFIRQVSRFQDPQTGKLLESLIRTMDRVRRSASPYPELRAYQLQELYRIANARPEAWGFLFSPSAQRDAEQLRRITQNSLHPYDFLFKDKLADLQIELRTFLVVPGGATYADEARFWRTTFAALRQRKLIFAGLVGRDGKPTLREIVKGSALYGLDNEGKASVLFRIGEDGQINRVAEAAPLTPLLRYPGTVAEATQAAGVPKGLLAPEGGWETLLQGRDL